MSIDIKQMMELVESGSAQWFYEHITGYEIKYENKNWNLRKLRPDGSYGGIWIQFNKDNYEKQLNRYQIDLYEFQINLYQANLNETVYHKMKYEELTLILGENEVKEAYEGLKKFANNIKDAIIDIERKNELQLLSDDN